LIGNAVGFINSDKTCVHNEVMMRDSIGLGNCVITG
jgi:hypothetical protein